MPIDGNGDKWACEPCIRGHRSTKCTHYERYMMRVKKPGRPLTSCPHPPKSCSCEPEKFMMVLIKKGDQCVCHPVDENGKPLNQEPSSNNLASYSVVQAAQAQAQGSLKQAQITTPHSFNSNRIHKNGRSMSNMDRQKIAGKILESDKNPKFISSNPLNTAITNGGHFSRYDSQPIAMPTEQTQLSNAYGSYAFNNGVNGLNGAKLYPLENRLSFQEDPSEYLNGYGTAAPAFISAIGNGSQPYFHGPSHMELLPDTSFAHVNQLNIGNGHSHDYPSATPTDPNVKATRMEWPNLPKSPTAPVAPASNVPQEALGKRGSNATPLQAPVNGNPMANGEGFAAAGPQNCHCGSGCNCILCPDHPYNKATIHHIQDLNHIIEQDLSSTHSRSSSAQISPTAEGAPGNGENLSQSPNGHHSSPATSNFPKMEPAVASTPNHIPGDFGSSASYFAVEYSLSRLEGFPCVDTTGTCRCDTNCSCIGCICHTGHEDASVPTSSFGNAQPASETGPHSSTQKGSCCQ